MSITASGVNHDSLHLQALIGLACPAGRWSLVAEDRSAGGVRDRTGRSPLYTAGIRRRGSPTGTSGSKESIGIRLLFDNRRRVTGWHRRRSAPGKHVDHGRRQRLSPRRSAYGEGKLRRDPLKCDEHLRWLTLVALVACHWT
jgi:hypothetical protein